MPEPLETRLAPTADLTALADGYVQGAYYTSGQGVQLVTNDYEVHVSSGDYQRGLILFDLGSLDPTARITSATLSLDVDLVQYGSGTGTPAVLFYGFQGDGVLGPYDFHAADSTLVGSLNTTNVGPVNVPISASFLQSIAGQGRYAELSVKLTAGEYFWFNSKQTTYESPPILHITYTHAPVAAADSYFTPSGSPLTVAAPGVLANDTDADGNTLTAALVSGPAHGTVALNSDGSFTYTPLEGYDGPDSFTYKANDGRYDSNVATVSLSDGTYVPPAQAANDAFNVPSNAPLSVAAPGVLGNDTSGSGGTLTAALVAGPAHGVLNFGSDGSFRYTPNSGYVGPDSFTYTAGDGSSVSNTATVTLNALGTISGRIWDDYNVDGKEGANEPGLAGRTVYLDQNQNGILDAGEPTAVTDATGTYTFNNLAPAAYLVALAPYTGWQQTAPTSALEQKVDIGVPGVGVLNFQELASTSDQFIGPYHRAGYTIDTGSTSTTKFSVFGSNSSYYPGSTALQPSSAPTTVTLRRDDGTPFGIAHVDLAEPAGFPSGYPPPTVTFVGNRPDGSQVTQAFRHDAFYNLEPYDFSGMTGLSTLTWAFSSLSNEVQFDNLWLESTAYSATGIDFGTVRSANSAPVAVNDSYKTPASTALTVAAPGILGNDYDPNGDPITPTLTSGVAHGVLNFSPDGSFTYTPTAGYNGPDSFTYTLSDGRLTSNTATVNIDVGVFNHPPVAADDTYTVSKSTALTVAAPGVLANDTDPDSPTITAQVSTYPAHGSLVLHADGSFTYTPFGAYLGTDSFTYRAFGGSLYSNTATVNLTVTGPDDPPIAANDSYLVTRNTAFSASAPGVLANDTDPNGQPITAVVATKPAHGTLTLASNGSFTYTPATNYSGPDSFTYTATDGQLSSNVATVSLYVDGTPVATADSYTTNENQTLNVAAPGVLANDTDPDAGDTLTAVLLYLPSHGRLTLNADGSLAYVPATYFYGTDSFSYRVWDGHVYSNTVADTITANHVNQPPVAVNDSYTAAYNGTLTAAVSQTYLNMQSDSGDWVGGGLTYNFNAGSGTYSLSGSASGAHVGFSNTTQNWSLNFSPPTGTQLVPGTYTNAARFPTATQPGLDVYGDGRGSNTVTGQFTVTQALYDAQGHLIAFSATFEQHSEGATPALHGQVAYKSSFANAEGLLFNDSDPDNDPLTVAVATGPAHGVLNLASDGSFTYTPNAGYSGPDSFTYTASDGKLSSNVATASIMVLGPPVVAADTYRAMADSPCTVAAPGVLANDMDPQNLPLTAALVAAPAHGSVTLNANGSFVYTPAANYSGTDSFTYTAGDGTYVSSTATVTVSVGGGGIRTPRRISMPTGAPTPLPVPPAPVVMAPDRSVVGFGAPSAGKEAPSVAAPATSSAGVVALAYRPPVSVWFAPKASASRKGGVLEDGGAGPAR